MQKKKRLLFFVFVISLVLLCQIEGAFAIEKEFITDVSITNAINLSGEWKYKKIEFIDESMVQPGYDDSKWLTVYAPEIWEEQGIEWEPWDTPLVLYRRAISVPAEWEGKQIGISCWFSKQSNVFINGVKVKPKGPLFARYGEVSDLLRYGKINYLAITALHEGKLVFSEGGPPRIGILEQRSITKVIRTDIDIPVDGERINAILFHPAGLEKLPGLILVATAHYGWGVTEPWFVFADELSRSGYSSLIIASKSPCLEHLLAAVEYFSLRDFIDSEHIGVIGANMAAKFAIMAAGKDQRIKSVVSMSSPPIEIDKEARLCPILLIASENDPNAARAAKNIQKNLKGLSELLIFEGKVHGITFIEEQWTTIREIILGWFEKHL